MKEYLDARVVVAKKKKHGYQIAKLAKGLEAAFAGGEDVIEVRFEDGQGVLLNRMFFTPVRKRLQKFAERMGALAHAQTFREPDDPWWARQWKLVEDAADELEWANKGFLLGPPLINRATGKMHISGSADASDAPKIRPIPPGTQVDFIIRFHRDLPADGA